MPGPMRYYATNAERQRAFRRWKAEAQATEQQEARDTAMFAYLLHEAVNRACVAGDPLASAVKGDGPFETLRALVEHFHEAAGTAPDQRPWKA